MVKDLELLQLRLRSQLQLGTDPWLGAPNASGWPKKRKKKNRDDSIAETISAERDKQHSEMWNSQVYSAPV